MPSHGSWRKTSARQLLSVCAAWSSSKVFLPGADVPSSVWRQLLEQASREIAILVYAALFLPEQQLDLVEPFQSRQQVAVASAWHSATPRARSSSSAGPRNDSVLASVLRQNRRFCITLR